MFCSLASGFAPFYHLRPSAFSLGHAEGKSMILRWKHQPFFSPAPQFSEALPVLLCLSPSCNLTKPSQALLCRIDWQSRSDLTCGRHGMLHAVLLLFAFSWVNQGLTQRSLKGLKLGRPECNVPVLPKDSAGFPGLLCTRRHSPTQDNRKRRETLCNSRKRGPTSPEAHATK